MRFLCWQTLVVWLGVGCGWLDTLSFYRPAPLKESWRSPFLTIPLERFLAGQLFLSLRAQPENPNTASADLSRTCGLTEDGIP